MKKILTTTFVFTLFLFLPFAVNAAPSCNSVGGVPVNVGDPACYTSTGIQKPTWILYDILRLCGGVSHNRCTDLGKYRTDIYNKCSNVNCTAWYPAIYGNVYHHKFTGATYCTNDGPLNQEYYNEYAYTCHYTTVNEWSECDENGIQSAISVTQHSTSGSNCQNLNEATTRICGVCDPATNDQGSGDAPTGNLCLIGTAQPVPPTLNTTTNRWEWSCLGDDGSSHTDDAICSAPRDEDGACAPGDPGAQGEYAWDASAFRGDLCSGGTPTISPTQFDTVLPMPATSGTPTTVTWGCNHIGIGISTDPNACSAIRNAPQPGVCGPNHGGVFVNESELTERCCNPDSYPPCTVDDLFAPLPIIQNGEIWSWTCNGSRDDGTDKVHCNATCIPNIDVDVSPNPFPLTQDGVTVEVTVTKTGDCAGEYTCTVDNQNLDSNNRLTFNNLTSPRDIVIACNGTEMDTIHIGAYCTQKACNAQGTCQSTPMPANSLDACKSTCNSDADCSSGRMIETRP